MTKEQVLMTVGGLLAVGVIAGLWALFRFYKHVGRRCDCGEMGRNYRVNKIRLPAGDEFNPYTISNTWRQLREDINIRAPRQSLERVRDTLKKFRWWMRTVQLVTFSVCPICGDPPPTMKVVTINERPISLWHLYWVWHFRREELIDDPKLNYVLERYLWALRENKRVMVDPENPGFQLTFFIAEKREKRKK